MIEWSSSESFLSSQSQRNLSSNNGFRRQLNQGTGAVWMQYYRCDRSISMLFCAMILLIVLNKYTILTKSYSFLLFFLSLCLPLLPFYLHFFPDLLMVPHQAVYPLNSLISYDFLFVLHLWDYMYSGLCLHFIKLPSIKNRTVFFCHFARCNFLDFNFCTGKNSGNLRRESDISLLKFSLLCKNKVENTL